MREFEENQEKMGKQMAMMAVEEKTKIYWNQNLWGPRWRVREEYAR